MKLGIIGLPQSGKTTLFEALTGSPANPALRTENRMRAINVPDVRVDALSQMYNPKKTVYAQVEYFLPGLGGQKSAKDGEAAYWAQLRACDAFIHVIGCFGQSDTGPSESFQKLNEDLIFADLVVAEKRHERLSRDKQYGRAYDQDEFHLLESVKNWLEENKSLRHHPELATAHKLRGFTFLSAKPMLILFNNEEGNNALPDIKEQLNGELSLALQGQIEHEIAEMSEEDAQEFLAEYNITEPATGRVLLESYTLLGLISFFTVGEDEVRAWTVKKDVHAVEAAEEIHSDIKKGFIRAEVVSYDHLMEAGSLAEARKKGTLRLEGKEYQVQDGDIVHFRFNV
ncbi:redox-regulated ATPase YchF [candidate division KSB1 bacterium]|nr:redox-regulated ATPase YchF [candidate division KSB1 bacterium]